MELHHHPAPLNKSKRPIRISFMFKQIESAIESFPKAMLFELVDLGFETPFQQLCACVISIRTMDEVSRDASLSLLRHAPTPAQVMSLSEGQIADLIKPVTFYRQKAKTLKKIAEDVLVRFDGHLPCEEEALLSLKGVGPKCANLVLGIACKKPFIGVDIHVHRVTNRWGYVIAKTPNQTLEQLQRKLPEEYWIDLNRLLVPFGKHICTGRRPKCSTCPVLEMCLQVDVVNPR